MRSHSGHGEDTAWRDLYDAIKPFDWEDFSKQRIWWKVYDIIKVHLLPLPSVWVSLSRSDARVPASDGHHSCR